ncbi:MAG: zf-HC2 domain-containing protein [Candidatus Cloacimonadaceae bacterium]|jgi:predicted anti-sigma-YlaC factor YlaD|nr:zf-HC2 domain-containing protein [Candidatus Cloacimonadota bacterium]MDX9949524.1 hypothetical protein [Candidatus Syntrophosphaera sp.]
MRCSKAKRLIELQLDNELGKDRALDLHLQNCAACRAYREDGIRLRQILNAETQPEFPGWLHHRIMDQISAHESRRVHLKRARGFQTIPALAAVALSLILGVAIGKTAYPNVNPLPENAAEIYSQQNQNTDNRDVAAFGESTVTADLF